MDYIDVGMFFGKIREGEGVNGAAQRQTTGEDSGQKEVLPQRSCGDGPADIL